MTVIFNISTYENTYGRKPRGRGSWHFECKGSGQEFVEIVNNETFARAKAVVTNRLKAKSTATHFWVKLLP